MISDSALALFCGKCGGKHEERCAYAVVHAHKIKHSPNTRKTNTTVAMTRVIDKGSTLTSSSERSPSSANVLNSAETFWPTWKAWSSWRDGKEEAAVARGVIRVR